MQDSNQPAEPLQPQSAAEAVHMLERTLEHFESVLGALEQRAGAATLTPEDIVGRRRELEELERAQRELVGQVRDALARLGGEASQLSESAAQLARVASLLEARVDGVEQSLERAQDVQEAAAPQPEPVPSEPQFQSNGRPLDIVLAAVPGFQGLMDVQRALSNMAVTEGASVVGYKNGEAALEVLLRAPVSARAIVEGLLESTGHQIMIEESRPEAQRLRLRFVE